nr:probable cytochrome P450 12a4, mitochondrial [Penaeus vannamei]
MMMSWAAKYYGGAARTFIKGIPAVGAFEVLSGSSRWKATLAAQAPKLEARPSRDIPGPKRWPGVASLPFVLSHKEHDPLRIYKVWKACVKEYGPVFRLDMPGMPPSVYISDPADIEHLFKSTTKEHHKPVFKTLSAIRDNHDFLQPKRAGILTEYGEEWWRVRRRVQPYTAKPKTVAMYLAQMDQVALDFVDRWADLRDENKELPSDFAEELYCWGLESLGLVIFNKRLGYLEGNPEVKDVVQMARDIFHLVQKLELAPIQWWKIKETEDFKQLRQTNDKLLKYVQHSVINACKSLEARSPDSQEELNIVERLLLDDELSFEDVHVYLMDLLTAGIDTTAMTVAFTLVKLAQNPEKQAKLHDELDTVLGDRQELLTPQHMGDLKYTKACVKETLRTNSPAILTMRKLYADTVLGGYIVPKGFTVNVMLNIAGTQDEHFPRAAEYLPERWLRHHPLGPINHYASIPFSTGLRNCVGRRLSEQESYTIVARLLHKYRLEWHYGDLDPIMSIVVTPDKPLKLKMIERK